jgi:hypothetical protein
MADPVMVYPLVSQWHFLVTQDSVSGVRVYLDGSAGLNVTQVELPKIGEQWDDDYQYVTCKSVDTSYLNDNDNCPKKYICAYDGVPFTQTAISGNENDLPKTVSIGGENRAFEPKSGTWKWESDGEPISNQNLNLRTVVANISISRVVKDFDGYMQTVFKLAGRINSEKFLGFPVGTVLFVGANMSEFKNRMGSKRWMADLNFQAKSCNGRIETGVANADGWTYSVREITGTKPKTDSWINGWDRPYIPANPSGTPPTIKTYLFLYSSFTELFEGNQLGDDENLYQPIPSK